MVVSVYNFQLWLTIRMSHLYRAYDKKQTVLNSSKFTALFLRDVFDRANP